MALTDEDRQARLERLQALDRRRERLEQLLAEAVREQNPGEQYALPSNQPALPLREVSVLRARRLIFSHFHPQQAAIEPRQEFQPVALESICAKLDEELPRPPQAPALQTQESEETEAPEAAEGVDSVLEMSEENSEAAPAEMNAEATAPDQQETEDSGDDDLEISTEPEVAESSEAS